MKICKIEGCKNKYYSKGFCNTHYVQKRRGQVLFRDFSKGRIRTDPNEFIIEGNICFISLYDNNNIKIAEAVIDTEDYERCKQFKWKLNRDLKKNDFRVASCKGGYLGPFIMRKKLMSKEVDHIDGNTLDNRKQNLQIITHRQNSLKRKMQKNNTSGYRGVVQNKNKWISQIGSNGKYYHLGNFDTKEKAALVYNEKAKEFFGEFAVLNRIKGEIENDGENRAQTC
jgi:hypothetical protein